MHRAFISILDDMMLQQRNSGIEPAKPAMERLHEELQNSLAFWAKVSFTLRPISTPASADFSTFFYEPIAPRSYEEHHAGREYMRAYLQDRQLSKNEYLALQNTFAGALKRSETTDDVDEVILAVCDFYRISGGNQLDLQAVPLASSGNQLSCDDEVSDKAEQPRDASWEENDFDRYSFYADWSPDEDTLRWDAETSRCYRDHWRNVLADPQKLRRVLSLEDLDDDVCRAANQALNKCLHTEPPSGPILSLAVGSIVDLLQQRHAPLA